MFHQYIGTKECLVLQTPVARQWVVILTEDIHQDKGRVCIEDAINSNFRHVVEDELWHIRYIATTVKLDKDGVCFIVH